MVYEIELPFEVRNCRICASQSAGDYLALTLKDEIKHLTEKHHGTRIKFKCGKCSKLYESKHAAICHIPKCPASKQSVECLAGEERDRLQCQECDRSYATKRGLSQHQRITHPEVRNRARLEAEVAEPKRPKDGNAFTADEIELMLRLEKDMVGERNIARAMAPFLPEKNIKQIRDKRNETAYKRWRTQQLDAIQPEIPVVNAAVEGAPPQPDKFTPDAPLVAMQINVAVEGAPPQPVAWAETNATKVWRSNGISTVLDTIPVDDTTPEAASVLTKITTLLRSKADGSEICQDEVDLIYNSATDFYVAASDSRCGGGGRKHRSHRKGYTGRRARKAQLYARTQQLFRSCPAVLAKCARVGMGVLELEDGTVNGPPLEAFKELYSQMWGRSIDCNMQEEIPVSTAPMSLDMILAPITTREVSARVARIRRRVAAGPDGLQKRHLMRRNGGCVLYALINTILLALKQPTAWRQNRTTLLLKEGKDSSLATNYRPITISSILSRIYWSTIDQRLRGVIHLNARQKGFVSEMGCYNNINILNELLAAAKNQTGGVFVQVDISKAFDTLPHPAIKAALYDQGLPDEVVMMIMRSYEGMHTSICRNGQTAEIELMRGVKQGDPLSPLIFNICMDRIITKLESMGGLSIMDNHTISCLAFADDLVLLANDRDEASEKVAELSGFLKTRGMSLAPDKCITFGIKRTKDAWVIIDPEIMTPEGNKLAYNGPENPFTYLGLRWTPWRGVDVSFSSARLRETVRSISSLALKPQQKVELLARYVLPHYIYAFVAGAVSPTELRRLDQLLRVTVKNYLHLPQSIADGLLYAGKKDGGLGFPRLETIVVTATLKAGFRFMASEDPAMRALGITSGLVSRLKKMAHAARLNWPVQSTKIIDDYKSKAKSKEHESWAALTSQGKGVKAYKGDKIGNEWLYRPSLLKPCRYITALKLRANAAGDKVSLNRAAKTNDILCRHCKVLPETLGHILGQCTYTKPMRIKRHNEIRDLIETHVLAHKSMTVSKEVRINDPMVGNLQPDLIIQDGKRVLVVDVTVRHEDGDLMTRGMREKLTKYHALKDTLTSKLGVKDFQVLPIVVGTRGTMPQQTLACLRELHIRGRGLLRTISMIALRGSIETYHIFMDYNAPIRHNIGQESVQ